MSMKFSVSFASRGAQRRHTEIIPPLRSQNSSTTAAVFPSSVGGPLTQAVLWLPNLQPSFRGDLEKEEQLQYIQLEREKRHGRWVNEQATRSSPPVLDHMAYCCEALKMLITAARQRQLDQQQPKRQEEERQEKAALSDTNGEETTSLTIGTDGTVRSSTPPTSPPAFDLKNIQNYRNLMEDVSIIVSAARQRTPEAGQKMIANVVEQLAVLQLWA